MTPELGSLSQYYEVGPRGSISTISGGRNDPGGKSYGLWQISSKTGALEDFVKGSMFKNTLSLAEIASPQFDNIWRTISQNHPAEFRQDQWHYIKVSHFDPAFNYWVGTLNLLDTAVINQVIWSMAVQHGRVRAIFDRIKSGVDHLSQTSIDEISMIKMMYLYRSQYVKECLDGDTLISVLNRYKNEEVRAIEMTQEEVAPPKPEPTPTPIPWWKKYF